MITELVSVIVPVFNSEKCLSRCLESILNQTYPNVEVIVIDDGSTDYSGDICDEYANKHHNVIVKHQRNEGMNAARNAGVRISSGKYIAFVDSDDALEENYLYDLSKAMHMKNGSDVVIGTMKVTNKATPIRYMDEGEISYTELWSNMLSKQYFSWTLCGKLYRKSCIPELKDTFLNAEDLYNNWRICSPQLRYYYIPKSGYIYNVEEGKYVGDIGPIEVLIKMGKELSAELRENDDFMDAYCIETLDNIFHIVRTMALKNADGWVDKVKENCRKWREWIEEYLASNNRYTTLQPLYGEFLKAPEEIIERYKQIFQILNDEKRPIYVYGAGARGIELAKTLMEKGVDYQGFVVSKGAENLESPDGIHQVFNAQEVENGIFLLGMHMKSIRNVLMTVEIKRGCVEYL